MLRSAAANQRSFRCRNNSNLWFIKQFDALNASSLRRTLPLRPHHTFVTSNKTL